MQCRHPQCRDHVSGPNNLRPGSTSCSTRATLEANSWINNWIVASYFCYAHIIGICISVMHGANSCRVKSRPFSAISYEGWLCWQHLQVQPPCLECTLFKKSYGCIVSNNLCTLLGGATEKYFKWTFLEIDGLICIQTFCHISIGGISNTHTLIQAIFSQYWHTSFWLELAFWFTCHWLTILWQYCTQPYLENINLQYNIFSGIKIPITDILTHMIFNLLECYIMCLRPLKQCFFLEQTY